MDEARTCKQWNAVMGFKPHAVASERAFNEATGLHLGKYPCPLRPEAEEITNARILSGSNLNNHETTRLLLNLSQR